MDQKHSVISSVNENKIQSLGEQVYPWSFVATQVGLVAT